MAATLQKAPLPGRRAPRLAEAWPHKHKHEHEHEHEHGHDARRARRVIRRATDYRGFAPALDLALATFGWGWHIEAGLAALRLVLRGTFDRHPDLQIVLGHWGEMLLFALDRIDGLSSAAPHLDRRVADYFATNIHIATSGMLTPRLLRHALAYTSVDRILLSGDHPFRRFDAATLTDFLRTLPDPGDRRKIAHANAESLYGLEPLPAGTAARTTTGLQGDA
ncbi:amidohydrolase family protein [Streptomyces sp. NPDC039016]|uniref:amidohydrolase family protein n=1 Tax=Streptomyces sp. NPDC039016 TaxID=3154330 RepID=UPI003407AD24